MRAGINPVAAVLLGLIAGAVAFTVLWAGWHLWVDHTQLHLIAEQVRAWQQAALAAAPK